MIDHEKMYKECWSLDITLAQLMLPKLLYFKNFVERHGYPSDFYNPETEVSLHEEWEEILDEIVWAVAYAANDYEGYQYEGDYEVGKDGLFEVTDQALWDKYVAAKKKEGARFDNGMRLFAKYFTALWD